MKYKAENNFSYSFWIWSKKIDAVIHMFSKLIQYEILEEELLAIKDDLKGTNDEKGFWSKYLIKGETYQIDFKFAYDAEEGSDMIHLKLETSKELEEKIAALDLFQSMFDELII